MGRSFENRKASMAKTQGAKTKLYSKYGKEIYVVAKNGGVDPDGNIALRRLIDKAKKDQVPAHVIEKAIDKAKGGAGEDYQPARYEGFGPGNCQVIVDCLTDNSNRTISEVRNCFTKTNSKLGAPGSVAHMFDHQAVFSFKGDEEAVLETLMMADVDVTDIEDEDGMLTVLAPHTEYYKAKTALTESFPDVELEIDEITFNPQMETKVTGEDVEMFEKFINMLNDCDDVQEIYHNADLSE
ncbi:YebC/PmpR family DNA-binding transcriptional regulator [Catenovulum sp. 2E275]|uniref:YebC/PmpR family DNA-binding transcriptional regulator n=1 Tax=Catenovulum sp. 2E275 TaxID=2980497 RepID=UPI0021D0AB76|nr:YebC/PmpR family DNA-binding transcriptional regulator [Catenovulum sp. 2E275]MCU4676393.1 YebC/PmpR family DNA-binding transcriptional regulator [Catenovulum sp. 2E275]